MFIVQTFYETSTFMAEQIKFQKNSMTRHSKICIQPSNTEVCTDWQFCENVRGMVDGTGQHAHSLLVCCDAAVFCSFYLHLLVPIFFPSFIV